MMVCPICNAEVKETDAFCPNCGTQFIVQEAPSQPAAPVYQQPPVQQTPQKKKTGLIIAIVAVVLLVLAGIGFTAEKLFQSEGYGQTDTNSGLNDEENNVQDNDQNDQSSVQQGGAVSGEAYTAFPTGFTATKIGTIADSVSTTSKVGVFYKDDSGKYHIVSLDGKSDTGGLYTTCDVVGNFFKVTTAPVTYDMNNLATLNCYGLVDVNGREIIPAKYAEIKKINDRYVRVIELTEQTENKDEMLMYYTDSMFSLSAKEGDILFKGNWYVFDTVAGKLLDGVTGTTPYTVSGYGNFVRYVTDDEQQKTVNDKGAALPEGADLFENGMYALNGAVYDSDGNTLFTYTEDGFVPLESEDDYILASKYGDVRAYVYMDTTGKVVSAEFTAMPNLYGELVLADQKLYDLSGNVVIEGTYEYAYVDKLTNNAWFLKNDDNYTLIKKDGTVLYQGTETEDCDFDTYSTFLMSKKVDDKTTYYSLKDKDFTIEGSSFCPWIVKVNKPDYEYALVDVISGTTILDGYSSFSCVEVPGKMMYVYAYNEDGTVDVYAVK
ncbi:MAG: zinc ribbon domain-containing protein [Clostridia bacterium]|nr:zinc ribbon domain-containing protein [Clostridia bacterium]